MKTAKKIAIAVVGGTVVLIGIALLVLPGPGILTILAGLAILAAEFAWARHLLHKAKEYLPKKKGAKPGDTAPASAPTQIPAPPARE